MAAATAPRQLTKRIPDDAVIYREYAHQIMAKGEYGAYSRTARVCGVSHVHVHRVIQRHGPKKLEVPELQYKPAPGEVELQNDLLLCQLLTPEPVPTTPQIMSSPSVVVLEQLPEVVPIELDWVDIPYTLNLNHGLDRTRANQRYEINLLAMVALLLTVLDVLVSHKALGLSLLLLPEILALWWIVAQMRRLLYLRK